MKKRWIILAAVLSAAIFKDPIFGPFIGLVVGTAIGIPVFLMMCFVAKLILRGKERRAEAVSGYITVGLLFLLFWIVYHPPASIMFRSFVAKPIPASVTNLKGNSRGMGFNCSRFLKFNINNNDLLSLIENKQMDLGSVTSEQGKGDIYLTITTESKSVGSVESRGFSFALSGSTSWPNPDSYMEADCYVKSQDEELEFILYNPDTEEAIYGLLGF